MTEQVKSELEIRKRVGDLEILKTVALEISAGRERSEIYSTIVSSAIEIIDGDAGGIGLFDEDRQLISIPFTYNFPRYITGMHFKLGQDLISQAIYAGGARKFDDYQREANRIEQLANAGMRAIALFPLRARGKVIGVLWVCMLEPGRFFSDYDMTLLESIGGQAAIALDNINLFEDERYISETLQRGFLPARMPELEHTDIGIFYASATIAAVVGGDFYDAIRLSNDRIAISLGDVSGKGVEATADAAMVKYTLRAVALQNLEPSSALSIANNIVAGQLTSGHFVTLVFGSYSLQDGQMVLGVAGHPPPLHYLEAENKVVPITGEDPAFGLIADYRYGQTKLSLSTGDILALYSDGIIELRRDKEFFGMERLGDLVAKYSDLSAQEIANSIIDSARDYSRDRLTDDIVLMVIKKTS